MIANIDPTPNAVVLDLSYITVTFDSDVMGVDASDLLINSTPATRKPFPFSVPSVASC